MANMQPKDVHYATEHDSRGIPYLMEHFGFEDEESLFKEIKKLMPSKSRGAIKKLKNMKKRQKNEDTANSAEENANIQENNPIVVYDDKVETEEMENSYSEECTDEEDEMNICMDLEQLQQKESELSALVCKLEEEHKGYISRRREIAGRLAKAENALNELLRLIGVQENNVITLCEEYNACASEMENINEKKNQLQKELDDVRDQITDLKKVTILVYRNGTIEVENAETPSIVDAEIDSEFKKMIAMPEAEELTIKEIKTIAKLQKMVKRFDADACKVELVFDSEEVQKFWETVAA